MSANAAEATPEGFGKRRGVAPQCYRLFDQHPKELL
jgi:hypothetical protein